jgi:cysteine desulfurase
MVGPSDPLLRSPHIVTVIVPGCRAADLLVLLDRAGIACSAGSACHAGVVRANPALLAMGYSEVDASSALRFSLGRTSSDADVDRVLDVLPDLVARARRVADAHGGAGVRKDGA